MRNEALICRKQLPQPVWGARLVHVRYLLRLVAITWALISHDPRGQGNVNALTFMRIPVPES